MMGMRMHKNHALFSCANQRTPYKHQTVPLFGEKNLYEQKGEICSFVQCPLAKGQIVIKNTQVVPTNVPSINVKLRVEAKTNTDKLMFCQEIASVSVVSFVEEQVETATTVGSPLRSNTD